MGGPRPATRSPRRRWIVGLVALACAAALTGGSPPAAGPQADRDWPVFGGNADNTRFTPLDGIDAATVGRLQVAWTRSAGFGQATWESFPLVVGDRMYVTTNTNAVWALDAATGAAVWRYTPVVDYAATASAGGSYFPTNRGVAVSGGLVYELTYDCYLLALDAATGRLRWRVRVADPRLGYYETTAPTVWRGLVFAGSSGGDSGARGFVAAYDAATGRQVWRRYTVPSPGHGWVPRRGHHGGGAVWMPPTVDDSTGLLYAGTGNPSPDFVGAVRPGVDPYTNGIIALRARTGAMVWYTSLVGHDTLDYDAASPVVLFGVRRAGRTVRAVGEAGKSGRYHVLDAATGRTLFAPVPFVPIRSGPGGVRCPGPLGGSEYSPVAYSPATQAAYVSGIDYCAAVAPATPAEVARHRAGEPDLGGEVLAGPGTAGGTFSAVDVNTGRLRWRRTMPSPMLGGATVTGGGLVFAGAADGTMYGFDARSGVIRWRHRLDAGFGSAPVVYAVGGREYLAVVSGGAAVSAIHRLGPVGATLVTFVLDP